MRKELINNKEVVLDIFEMKKHKNLRTLIFGIIAYEKFFEALDEIEFRDDKYLQKHKEQILKYTIELSIRIKLGKSPYLWKSNDSETGMIYWENFVDSKGIYGYRFVDLYLLNRYFNKDEVKKIMLSLMDNEKEKYDNRKKQDNLKYNELYYWWELEDDYIEELLLKLKAELKEKKYDVSYFKEIVSLLMQLKYHNFNSINYSDYIELMKDKLEEDNVHINRKDIDMLSNNDEFVKEYLSIIKPLLNIIENKEKEKRRENNNFILDLDQWDDDFASKCEKNKRDYQNEKKFLFYIEPDILIEMFKKATVKQLNCFLEGINEIYNFSNLHDFFKADEDNIKNILSKLDVEKLSENKITRKLVFNKIEHKLEEALNLIKQ